MSDDIFNMIAGVSKPLVAVLAPAIAGLVTVILVQVLRRLGYVLEAEKQAKTEHLVEQAILRAEEWGAQRLKASMSTSGPQKLDRAVADVTSRDPSIQRTEAVEQIHALLPKLDLGASAPPVPAPPFRPLSDLGPPPR